MTATILFAGGRRKGGQPTASGLSAPAGVSGTLAVITRQDGTQQVTYNHKPLYTTSCQPSAISFQRADG